MSFTLDERDGRPQINWHCFRCTQFLQDATAAGAVCRAFPDGIPDLIWSGQNDHTAPVSGDHGIQFEQAPGDWEGWT